MMNLFVNLEEQGGSIAKESLENTKFCTWYMKDESDYSHIY